MVEMETSTTSAHSVQRGGACAYGRAQVTVSKYSVNEVVTFYFK